MQIQNNIFHPLKFQISQFMFDIPIELHDALLKQDVQCPFETELNTAACNMQYYTNGKHTFVHKISFFQ